MIIQFYYDAELTKPFSVLTFCVVVCGDITRPGLLTFCGSSLNFKSLRNNLVGNTNSLI